MLVAIDLRFTELFQFKSRLNGFAVQQGAGDGREGIAGCRRIVGDPFGISPLLIREAACEGIIIP
ncbi:Uncharacterised protein [Klebsiella aerogenes]|nr:Uncharacterised protein [Klebsiella aerogenes]